MTTDARAASLQHRLLTTLEHLLAIQALAVKPALDEASHWVAEALRADKTDAFLHDPATDSLVALGTSDTPMGRLQHRLGLHRLPLANGGRAVAVYQTGVPFRTGHTDADPDDLQGMTKGLGVRSTIAAVIAVDGERRGVLMANSARPNAFSATDLRFCAAVAHWVGLVAHRAELAERLARDAAAQARRGAAEELISMLAHDLRTPLTPARGYLDLLQRDAQQAGHTRAVGYVQQVQRALDRVQHMIGAILDASRLEQGLFALTPQPLDLAALVRDTAHLLHTPQTPIHFQGPADLIVEGADPERLRQALENLIGNALAHTPPGVPVVVALAPETRAAGAWAVLSVRDDGPGIAPSLLPTVFDRFVRGSPSTGLGLGLYLARGIAEAHGGALTVESPLGAGTTFRLALPTAPAALPGALAPALAPA